MALRTRFLTGLAGQLGRPEGLRGRLLVEGLNRGNKSVISAAVEACALRSGMQAADIGFGGGVGLPMVLSRVRPGGQAWGVDLSETMVRRARRRYRRHVAAGDLTLTTGSLTALPLPQASLDAVLTVNTIYFVADLEHAFRELRRVLRADGRAVIGLADPAAMAAMPFTASGFVLRPVEEVVAALTRSGFGAVECRPLGRGEAAYQLLVADPA